MSYLLNLIHAVLPATQLRTDSEDAYLAASSDLSDVERRVRTIDGQGRDNWSPIAFGLYVR